ncbi:MAG: DUF4350 domain-containing protein [Acidimicrobiia bacterium]
MSSARARWDHAPPGVRAAAIVGSLLLVAMLAVTFVDRATSGRPVSSADTQGSARSTASNGTKAFRLLLENYRIRTTNLDRRVTGVNQVVSPNAALMVLDRSFPSDRARAAVREFAARGGRVVLSGIDAASWLTSDRPSPVQGNSRIVRVRLGGDYIVLADGLTRWRSPTGPQLVVTRTIGRGEILLVADDTPIQNARLGRRDNAAFALALTGSRRQVVFADAAATASGATGWDAVPSGWKIALIGGAFALLLTAIALGRRIGHAEPSERLLDPPRRVTADVLAGGLERSRHPALALDALGAAVRSHIIDLAHLEPDADAATLVAAAVAAGWDPKDAAALVTPPTDQASVLALGRAYARSQRGLS